MKMDFMRHLRPEYRNEKRAATSNALKLFQSVELSLPMLLPSSAPVRFAQPNKIIFLSLTQFIEQTQADFMAWGDSPFIVLTSN